MLFDAFRAKIFVAGGVCAKVCNGLFFMKIARDIIFEISLHIINGKRST